MPLQCTALARRRSMADRRTKENNMDPKVRRSWEEFLNPEVARPRLIAASIYIAAFEILKESVVVRIRDFFCTGVDESGDKIDPEYQADVLSRNRSPIYASLGWLKERNALDDRDLRTFDCIKACRNTLAHNLVSTLGMDGLPADFEKCFTDMVALLRKIEVWWTINVEISTNPDFASTAIDEGEIVPGSVVFMQLLMDIALGDEERSKFYYDEFRKRTGGG
jgi:hypothetical protein